MSDNDPKLDPADPSQPSARKPSSRMRRLAKWAGYIAGACLLLAFAAVVALVVALRSPRVHSLILTRAEGLLSEQLGTGVHLQNFDLNLSSLSLELYGITIDGAAPYTTPPLLQLAHAQAGVRIPSILGRKWYLSEVTIDHPVVQIYVDKDGVSNLPRFNRNRESSSNTSIFDLGIRHAVLTQGAIFYNSRPATLSADLRDLNLHASFHELTRSYEGDVAYTDGHIEYGTWQPQPHALSAQFSASPKALQLSQVKLSCGPSTLSASGTLTNYDDPTIDAKYDANIDGGQIAGILHNDEIPAGMVHTTGSLHYAKGPSITALQALTLQGTVAGHELNLKTGTRRMRVTDIEGNYALANGNLSLPNFRASLLGGGVNASGEMKDLGGNSSTNIKATVRNLSLAEIHKMLNNAALQDVAITGTVSATASASWGKTIDDLTAKADATIDGKVMNAANSATGETPLPLDSILHGSYTNRNHQLTLNNSYLRTPQSEVTLNGTASQNSSLAVHLQANDLREVATIVRVFQPSAQLIDLTGQASFVGDVRGSLAEPHITGQLTAQDLHFHGTEWKTFRAGLDLSPSRASIEHADLESAARGRVQLNGNTELTNWVVTKSSPASVEMHIGQMDIADVLTLANQSGIPVTGTLNGDIRFHGSAEEPLGTGTISVTDALVYKQPVQSAKITLTGEGRDLQSQFALDTPAGRLQGSANLNLHQRTYTAQLTSTAIELEKLQAVQASGARIEGAATLHASGEGTFDDPQMTAALSIPKIVIEDEPVTSVDLKMNIADHVGHATLAASAINTNLQGKATVQLSGDYLMDASLDTQDFALQPLLAVYGPSGADGITGDSELHATAHGPLKTPQQLEAHVTIPVLKLAYGNTITLAADAPIHMDYQNQMIRIQPAAIRGTDTDLQFEGTIPTTQNGPMALKLLGTVDLRIAQLFNEDMRTEGQLKFNIDSHGATNNSQIGGEIDIVDASLSSPDLPVGIQHGNGVLRLTRDRVDISDFKATAGGGTVTAQGGLRFGNHMQFDVGLNAHEVRAQFLDGMRATADGDLRFTGTPTRANLNGSVSVSDVSFTPAFDLDTFIGQFAGGVAPPPTRGFTQNVSLNIAAYSTNNISLVSRTLSVDGTANLQVRGTLADPVILGRVLLNDGDVLLGGKRFLLQAGTIQFINPSETQPVLNVTITTTIQQYDIHLRFNGPSDQLKTQYTSDPALPPADIINLLAFGETTEASAQSPTTANQAAQSMLASQVSSQVTSRVSKIAGISQLSINPVLATSSSQGSPGANITIQQRVTSNLFVTFSTNVGTQQTQTIQGQYQLTPRVAISVTSDPNGGFAFDTLIKRTW